MQRSETRLLLDDIRRRELRDMARLMLHLIPGAFLIGVELAIFWHVIMM
jgi:hypothetical protein